jgi:hypothetical protein
MTTCTASATAHGTYTIVGSKSTGKWAGATGSGHYTLYFSVTVPRMGEKCDFANNVTPVSGVETFHASGPVTIKS